MEDGGQEGRRDAYGLNFKAKLVSKRLLCIIQEMKIVREFRVPGLCTIVVTEIRREESDRSQLYSPSLTFSVFIALIHFDGACCGIISQCMHIEKCTQTEERTLSQAVEEKRCEIIQTHSFSKRKHVAY